MECSEFYEVGTGANSKGVNSHPAADYVDEAQV